MPTLSIPAPEVAIERVMELLRAKLVARLAVLAVEHKAAA